MRSQRIFRSARNRRLSRRRLNPLPGAGTLELERPQTEAYDENQPAWRALLRFGVLALLAIGAVYLSLVSVNLLVLGTDDVDYSQHTDTIMLLHWQPLPRRLAMLSIPRDTLITLPKRGPIKINAVYAYGNALNGREFALAMTRSTVENLLGLRVHYLVHIHYSDFIRLVDALGGVPLYVPKAMHYVDRAGGVNIDLEPGYQLLDGRQALNYVRFRQDSSGDIGRIRRQQEFMKAFLTQLVGITHLPRTVRAIFIFLRQVESDLSLATTLFLAMEIRGVVGLPWRQAILPGRGVYMDGISYWQTDPQEIKRVLAELGRPPTRRRVQAPAATPAAVQAAPRAVRVAAPAEPVRRTEPTPAPARRAVSAPAAVVRLPAGAQPVVRVLNGCGVSGVAGRVTERLRGQRIRIEEDNVTNAPSFDFSATIIKSSAKNLPWARAVAKILNLDGTRIQVVPAKFSYPTVTVVVGADYSSWLK